MARLNAPVLDNSMWRIARHELLLFTPLVLMYLIASATGSAWFWMTAGWIVWCALQAREVIALAVWSRDSLSPPRISGIWRLVANRVYNSRRASRERIYGLLRQLRRYQVTTAYLPDAMVLLSKDDLVQWFNEPTRTILRLQNHDLGRHIGHRMRHPSIDALLNDEIPTNTVDISSPMDDAVSLDVRLIPATAELRLMIVRDVSELQKLQTMRQDFIANVSHEMRTPLTVIIGYLETMEDEVDPQVIAQILKRLISPAQRMKALVDDLLLLSKLDSSQAPAVETLPVIDVERVLESIVRECRQISDGQHEIELQLTDSRGLRGVESEIVSAFTNLVVNAIRYSPSGGKIGVVWSSCKIGARFEVSDCGIGIPEEHIGRLTERFYRVDVGRSRVKGGTGLGLAIVKHVLRRHDSELSISSELGAGSTFACEFPERRLG